MRRPGWGTAAAIYNWISGAFSVLSGFGLIIASAIAMDTLNQIFGAFGVGGAGTLMVIGISIGLITVLMGVLQVVCGYGLWMLRNWARITSVVLYAVSALLTFVLIIVLLVGGTAGVAIIQMFGFVINIVFLVGLLLPGTALGYSRARGMQQGPTMMPQPYAMSGGGPVIGAPAPIPPTQLPTNQMAGHNPGPRPAAPVARTEMANRPAPVLAWLVERNGPRAGREHRLQDQVTLGRDPGRCEVVLDDTKISGEHARIRMEQGQFVLYDLASTNHTYVNDQPIQKHVLHDGDQIKLGPNVQMAFMRVSK